MNIMSIRSDVALVIAKELFDKEATVGLRNAIKTCDEVRTTELAYYFRWDSVKWYEDFADVKIITKFVRDNQMHSGLLIIGEDQLEEMVGSPSDFDLYIQHNFDMPSTEEIDHEQFFASNSVKYFTEEEAPSPGGKT